MLAKQALQKVLGDNFVLHTAFSRDTPTKVYVQHCLAEKMTELCSMWLDHHGSLYICGDARMARDVHVVLCELISRARQISLSATEAMLRDFKTTGRLQVRQLHLVHYTTCAYVGELLLIFMQEDVW